MTRNRFFAALLFCAIPAIAADRYLVKWETVEKCHECTYRYAMGCSTPDCNTPNKTVAHYQEFDSLKEAMAFANPSVIAPCDGSVWPCGSGTITGTLAITGRLPSDAPPSSAKQVVGIYLIKEIPTVKDVIRTEVPQPAKIEEKFMIVLKP